MGTGESEAGRAAFGYLGMYLLVILAIFGALFLAGGIREVARQNRSAEVFSARADVRYWPAEHRAERATTAS